MSKIKKIFLCLILFLIVIFIKNTSKATKISVSPSNPQVGDTVTITITVPKVHTSSVTANISGVVSGTIKVVGGDLNGEVKDYSNSEKFKCESAGKINVTIDKSSSAVLDGNYVDVSASKTINVKESQETTPVVTPNENTSQNTNDNESNNTGNENIPEEKSKIATLSNLGIKPNDFSGFRAGILSYDVKVENDVEQIEVYANKGQANQTISGTGIKKLNEGLNTFNIEVTAEDGETKKTYTINVTRSEKSDEEEKEKEDDEQEKLDKSQELFGLTELKIKDISLKPKFQTDVYEYKINIKEDIEKLDITALATEINANVEITGNTNLKEGENVITIVVTNENKENTVTYQIVANKTITPKAETLSTHNTSNNKQKEKAQRIILLIVASVIIILIIAIFIIAGIRKNRQYAYEYDGSEEDNEDGNDNFEDLEENSASFNKASFENKVHKHNDENEYIDEQESKEDIRKKEQFYEEIAKKEKHQKGKRFK